MSGHYKIGSFRVKHLPSQHIFRPILQASTKPTELKDSSSNHIDTSPEDKLKQVIDESFRNKKNKLKRKQETDQAKDAGPLNPEVSAIQSSSAVTTATTTAEPKRGKASSSSKKKKNRAAGKKGGASIFDDY